MKKKALYVLIGLLIGALGIFVAARQRSAAETRAEVVTATPVQPTVTTVPWDAQVNALSNGLRELPHLNSKVMERLMGGTKIDLLAVTEDREWVQAIYALEDDSTLTGWLQVDMLRLNVSLDDLDVDTETVFVLPSPEGDQPAATPAPEPTPLGGGGKIAFSSDRDGDFEIYFMNWDGTNQVRLTNQSTHDFFPEFSPDGDTVLFFAVDADSNPPSGEFQFVGIDGTHEGTFGAFGFGSASWSPNGQTIARSIDVGAGNTEILIAEFGVPPYLLTSNPAPDRDPAWSPDGKTLAFASLRDGIQKIYVMDANGNNLRRLTDTVRVEAQPSWSPDGTRIAFVSGDNVTTQIYIMNSDGTEVTKVTNGPGFNENPTWSPDGTMLAFWSNRSGNLQIYTIRSDGTQLTRLTSNAFNDENPDWAP
jgi:TolB protein